MDPSAMYVQHGWSPTAWALLLTVMAVYVTVAIVVMLLSMLRIESNSGRAPELTTPELPQPVEHPNPTRPLVGAH